MMITHYLKVAFRNLWKYKTQHLIALAGVGVALLCFSICLYLVRYAFSMNHCFANYERIAELNIRDMKEGKVLNYTPATLAEELRLQKPDGIEALCVVDYSPIERPFNVEMPDGKQLPYYCCPIKSIEYKRISLGHCIFNGRVLFCYSKPLQKIDS